MQQYDKSGPVPQPTTETNKDIDSLVKTLESRVAKQDRLIESLQQDIRRLKDKLDRHADHINRHNRG